MPMKPQLTLMFDPGFGEEPLRMVVDLDQHEVDSIKKIRPPGSYLPGQITFDHVVEILKTRDFRKDKFIAEATKLGAALAERMEDAEGWNDISRIEPAKKELRCADRC